MSRHLVTLILYGPLVKPSVPWFSTGAMAIVVPMPIGGRWARKDLRFLNGRGYRDKGEVL